MKDRAPFGLGGLWENWRHPAKRRVDSHRPDRHCAVERSGRSDSRPHAADLAEGAYEQRWLGTDPDTHDLLMPFPAEQMAGAANDNDAADVARTIVGIIKRHHIVDVWSNELAQNKMRNAIDDYFFDVVRDQRGIDIPLDQLDELELQIMDVARARFPG